LSIEARERRLYGELAIRPFRPIMPGDGMKTKSNGILE
jgi:hypothetical protein